MATGRLYYREPAILYENIEIQLNSFFFFLSAIILDYTDLIFEILFELCSPEIYQLLIFKWCLNRANGLIKITFNLDGTMNFSRWP